MNDVSNPRAVEIMTVAGAIGCMQALNENDLSSLNIRWAKGRVEQMRRDCEVFLDVYTEEKIRAMEDGSE